MYNDDYMLDEVVRNPLYVDDGDEGMNDEDNMRLADVDCDEDLDQLMTAVDLKVSAAFITSDEASNQIDEAFSFLARPSISSFGTL